MNLQKMDLIKSLYMPFLKVRNIPKRSNVDIFLLSINFLYNDLTPEEGGEKTIFIYKIEEHLTFCIYVISRALGSPPPPPPINK